MTFTAANILRAQRQSAVDRADLRLSVRRDYFGNTDSDLLTLRMVNYGRRVVRVERAGLWHEQDNGSPALPIWETWESLNRRSGQPRVTVLPHDLGEAGSHEVWVFPLQVAQWQPKTPAPAFVWVEDSLDTRHWLTLDDEWRNRFSAAYDEARDLAEKARAKQEHDKLAAALARNDAEDQFFGDSE